MENPERLKAIELFAWMGEDELGSGEVGIKQGLVLKQGLVPAGMIPIVAVDSEAISRSPLLQQMNLQATASGKRIYLCRFTFAEVVCSTAAGQALG